GRRQTRRHGQLCRRFLGPGQRRYLAGRPKPHLAQTVSEPARAMSAVFEQLPGFEVPVGDIKHRLAQLWDEVSKSGDAAPATNEVRAMQMNFVLHFGFATEAVDAVAQFDTIKAFAQRYPCR